MKNSNLDESKNKNKNKEGLLLLKHIITPDEYRAAVGLPEVKSDKSVTGLVVQLEENQEPEKELWWATLQDIGYLLVHATDGAIKVAIVADAKRVIVCELPSDYNDQLFVEEWRVDEQ